MDTTETGLLGLTADDAEVHMDLQALIGSHLCLVANSGGGKSGAVRRLLETTHGRIQHIILDGEDEYYTLRERFDYVIAGGETGDVPATLKNAKDLALGALEHGFSLICQLNDLGFMGAPEFIGAFLDAMIHAPRRLWHPVLIVVDEIQRFAPRQGSTGATSGIQALLSQGRKRGFTAVMAGVKLSEIDPTVRGMVNNWILGRVGQAIDRNTMADALGFTAKEGRERLRLIHPRHFWGFGPAIAPEPVLFRVADVETTLLRPGDAKVPTPPAPEALRDILAGMAPAPDPAPAEGEDAPAGDVAQRDPADAEEIERLAADYEALAAHAGAVEARATEAEVQRDQLRAKMLSAVLRIQAVAGDLEEAVNQIAPVEVKTLAEGGGFENAAGTHVSAEARPGIDIPRVRTLVGRPVPEPAASQLRQMLETAPATAPTAEMGVSACAFADFLDKIAPAKVTWAQLAGLTKRKARGGSFNTARNQLRASGRMIEEGKFLRSSRPAGRGMNRDQALAMWRSVLTGRAPELLDLLAKATNPMTKGEIGEALGLVTRGGAWNGLWGQLRNNDLLKDHGDGFGLADKLPGER